LFSQLQQLPLRRIRGQISVLKETAASRHLKTVICGHGYVAPSLDGFHTLGATYGVDDDNIDVRMSDHAQNLDTLQRTDALLPALFAPATDPQLMTGRAAIRCTTPDYLPLAGPAPDLGNFIDTYSDLRRNAKRLISASGPFWPGLWLNCGHGSRGFSYAPLAAELVASQIDQQPLPLPRHLVTAVNPARFIIRDLKRNRV
jgi:tRNA 5-methylaminomethyl-2-thiouridine biosynthesis bifunctional protein